MNFLKRIIRKKVFIVFVILIVIILILANWPSKPSQYEYGITFSSKYTRELGLDPVEAFQAIISEFDFKKVRLVAYWDEIEREQNKYDFSDLDWQIAMAEKYDLEIVLAIGRRVPRWPECHFPQWIYGKSWEKQQDELIDYIRELVNRYKDSPAIKYWQVENEPFLTAYVPQICGSELDKTFLDKEIALVKMLDPTRQIITTDSGNLGLWLGAYKRGDIFGSTFYIYLTNDKVGEIKSGVNHNFYKAKRLISQIFYGKKPTWLIEVSVEPWLVEPIIKTPIDVQLEFMNIDRIEEILQKSAKTNFDEIYLWGIEWWYYLKKNGHPEIWNYMLERI
ncbi:MAG TPA: cellulase family glycosylhydrolase [Candidatus Paceibacterota bacterium]|nr:cellulase family glycosylhydrolase [Candidatus Paceibacterota bacterium]HMP18914.1 cellulase family glycosylhydrolase [Candidatus Paceibacterota bacterium]HMP85075.1 cellulase family glycosylhydrolase [Candidatus Paceibacterota bacterium]